MNNLKYKLVALSDCEICCSYCGIEQPLESLVADHVIPKCQGGSNHQSNLMLSCIPCNNSKGGKNLEQYRVSKSIERRGLKGVINLNSVDLFASLGIDLDLTHYLFHFERGVK